MGGEPLLPAFLWRDFLSAQLLARSLFAEAVAQVDLAGGCGMASEQDNRGGAQGSGDLRTEHRDDDSGHDADGERDCHRGPVVTSELLCTQKTGSS